MKPRLLAAVTLIATIALPVTARGQQTVPSPLVRGDVTGTIGWLNGNRSDVQTESYNNWYNRGLYAGAVAGWYWTDHHKTQVEAGITNSIDFRTYGSTIINGSQGWSSSDFRFTLGRAAVGQHYQFFRNAWVHPHVGAGVDLTWERVTEHAEPIMGFDPITGRTKELRPAGTFGPSTTLHVRPYVETGFKAYATRRAFFRGDLRILARHGIEEVLLRCGFGIDF